MSVVQYIRNNDVGQDWHANAPLNAFEELSDDDFEEPQPQAVPAPANAATAVIGELKRLIEARAPKEELDTVVEQLEDAAWANPVFPRDARELVEFAQQQGASDVADKVTRMFNIAQ